MAKSKPAESGIKKTCSEMEHWNIIFSLHHHPPAAASQTGHWSLSTLTLLHLSSLASLRLEFPLVFCSQWLEGTGNVPASPRLNLGLTRTFRLFQFLFSEKQRQDCGQAFPLPLFWAQVSPDHTKISFAAPFHRNHGKTSPKAASPEALSSLCPWTL